MAKEFVPIPPVMNRTRMTPIKLINTDQKAQLRLFNWYYAVSRISTVLTLRSRQDDTWLTRVRQTGEIPFVR